MPKFSPAEIDAFLNTRAQRPEDADVPADFFEKMEERILAATTRRGAASTADQAQAEPTPIVAMRTTRTRTNWRYAAAAAAIVVLISTFAVKYSYDLAHPSQATDNIYAISDEMTDDDIEDLDDLYEADIFLEQL